MASAITSCVSGLRHVSSSDEEKEMFFARVEWLPVTSLSQGRKISIMILSTLQVTRANIMGVLELHPGYASAVRIMRFSQC